MRSSSQPLNAFLRSLTPVPSLFHCGPPRIPTCLLSAPGLPLHGPRSQGSQYKPCLPPREKFAAPGSSTQWSLGGTCGVHLWGEQRPDPFMGGRSRRACKELLHSCLATCQARTGSLARKGPAYRCVCCAVQLPTGTSQSVLVSLRGGGHSHLPATCIGLPSPGRACFLKDTLVTWRKWFLENEIFLPETANMLPLCSVPFLLQNIPIYL